MKLNWVVKNLLLGVVFVLGLVLLISLGLHIGTRHGSEIVLPDFSAKTLEEAEAIADECGVRVVAGDSVYIPQMRKDGVYLQTPKAGTKVKKGRRVILTVNSRTPKMISMPSLVGYQMSQAKSELMSKGLRLGTLQYERDIATNIVLRQYYNGVEIAPGAKIRTGSVINLAVGLSSSDCMTYVPKLIGFDYARAVDMIQDNSLNVGRLSFDRTVKSYSDSLRAVVYEQSPRNSGGMIRMGTYVNLKLTLDNSKLKK